MTLFTTINNYSQDIPAVSRGKLKFYFDSASFKGIADSTYQEFYLMFHSDQIKEIETDTNSSSIINLETKIFSPAGVELSKRSWVTEINFQRDSTEFKDMVTFDQWGDYLVPGIYNISINVSDSKGITAGTLESDFEVKQIDGNSFSLSDVQLVFKTEDETENKLFRKAGKNVFPNVWRRYGVLNPKLSFYYEIYGVDTTVSEPLLVDYTIINEEKEVAKKISGTELKRDGNERSVLQALDISNLSSSLYNLEIVVTDPYSDKRTSQNKKFEVIQFDRLISKTSLSPDEIYMFDHLFSYLADKKDYQLYKRLNDNEKGIFIVEFWKSKDPTPSTPENEYLLDIVGRFKYANNNFSWGNIQGWKSDRGRVLLQYGMPDQIESHDSEPTTVPYVVWTYQMDKNYIFVFIDKNSTGNFILTHSNKEGEVSNPTWISLVKE
jgi:GWxTD domain-containing protein